MKLSERRKAIHDQESLGSAASWVIVALGLWTSLMGLTAFHTPERASEPQSQAFVGPLLPPPPSTFVGPKYETAGVVQTLPPEELDILAGALKPSQTLSTALRTNGVSAGTVHEIAEGMRGLFDFRYSRPGDEYWLARDSRGELVEFRYKRSEIEQYLLRRHGVGEDAEIAATAIEPDIRVETARLAGVIQSSLYEAMEGLGEEGELAHDFASIFAWDVDFARNVQPGDEFRVLYERRMLVVDDDEDTYLGPGRILAAHYANAVDSYSAMYFETSEGRASYYRLDGSSVERQFLRAPLKYSRISSSYTSSRLHPILKVRRPHPAIDYAAPTGTPVWSVADGKVIYRGVMGGLGKTVKVRHANGYVTYYAHLSRFGNVKVGDRVRQKQVVGHVGSTGISTGPHLDFRMKHHGKYVNPATVQTPPGDPIPDERMPDFLVTRDHYLDELEAPAPRILTQEAAS